jgi:hypothetical protein
MNPLPLAPHEFTAVPFPVKAIKLLLKDLQTSGEAATMAAHSNIPDFEPDSGSEGVSPNSFARSEVSLY